MYPAGVLLLVGLVWLGQLGAIGEARGTFLLAYGLAAAGYLLFLRSPGSRSVPAADVLGDSVGADDDGSREPAAREPATREPAKRATQRAQLIWILSVAVLARGAVVGIPASDDAFRYLWEGRAQSFGLNPYLTSPAEGREQTPDDPYVDRINHPEWTTIYAPVAQWLFRAVAAVSYELRTWKWLCLVADLALIGVLCLWTRSRGQPVAQVGLYAWHPLPALAFAGAGHLDVWMLLALWLGFLALRSGRPFLGVIAWILAVGFKFVPAALVAFYARAGRWAFVGIGLAAAGILLFPFRDAGFGLISSLLAFGERLGYNSPANWVASGVGPAGRWGLLFGFVVAVVWASWRWRSDPERGSFLILGWFLVLSPTIHPWYLTWILPFLIRFRSGAWTYLGLVVAVAYLAYGDQAETGVFRLSPLWTLLQFLPFYLLLAGAWRGRRQGAGAEPA